MPRTLFSTHDACEAGEPLPLPVLKTLLKQIEESNLPRLGKPQSLTIRFSRASDLNDVLELYGGVRKQQIDPKGFVRDRSYNELEAPVKNGAAALAIDERGFIRAAALASLHRDGDTGKNNIIEIGAVLCDVGGVGLSKVVLSMLALQHQFDPNASGRVFAKVAADNGASNKIFSHSMEWDTVCPQKEAPNLYDVAYRLNQGNGHRDRLWYAFRECAAKKAVDTLRNALDSAALHGKDGSTIPLNISESSICSTLNCNEMLASPCASA